MNTLFNVDNKALTLEDMRKKYSIIYADPPWKYKDTADAGKRGAEHKYPVLKLDDIKELDIASIAAKDCVLFLWATYPKLSEALEVIKAWGFTYKTLGFDWVKRNKKKDSFFLGMGRWTRSNSEVCLFATKGKPKRISASVHSVIYSPVEKHSKKPDIVRDKIIELCGDLPRIELFARQVVDGWDCLGNEIDGRDIRDILETSKGVTI